jgi:hypothetical protein
MRAMGLNIAGDHKLQSYFRHLLGMPELSEEDFKKIYECQAEKTETTIEYDTHANDNPNDRPFEQNDMNYTGGEM